MKKGVRKATEKTKDYLQHYIPKVRIRTMEEALSVTSVPEGNKSLTEFCVDMIHVFNQAIARGFDVPYDEEDLFKRIDRLVRAIRNYQCQYYSSLKSYELEAESAKWNSNGFLFHLICTIYLFRDSTYEKLHPKQHIIKKLDYDYLYQKELLLYPEKKSIRSYTQLELHNTLLLISSRWHYIEYDERVYDYLEELSFRGAQFAIHKYTGDIMDGKEDRDKTIEAAPKSTNPNVRRPPPKYSSSPDYVVDLASLFTHFYSSFFYRTFITTEAHYSNMDHDETTKWNGYDTSKIVKRFSEWIVEEAKTLKGTKFKESVKKTLLIAAFQRPGDFERFERDNAGLSLRDAQTVIENSRTAAQISWYTVDALRGGIPRLINSSDLVVRSITIAKVFHFWCESRMKFSWWIYCFVLEQDIMTAWERTIRLIRRPIIIQQIGEFNVWYKETIYRTITIEKAIVLWVIMMVVIHNCGFKRRTTEFEYSVTTLYALKELLKKWNDDILVKEDGEQQDDGTEPNSGIFDRIDIMEDISDVFTEM
jgi:hypothetical protein